MSDLITPGQAGNVGPSRRGLLTKATLTGLAAVPVISALSSSAQAYTGPQSALDNNAKEAFRDIRKHENDHVAFLVKALGNAARPKPTFKNLTAASFSQFVTLSRTFEITGVAAYLGATPSIDSTAYLAAAGSIALIEGRHSGFLTVFSGRDVTTQAATNTFSSFDQPLTPAQVVNAVTPFIASLNGGSTPGYTQGTRSPANDIAILNFALALEYLEAEFYNINVPKFVGL